MSDDYGSKYIRFDEAVYERVQPSVWHFRKRLSIAAGLLVLSFFLVYPLIQLGLWGFAVFAALLGASATVLATTLFMRARTVAIITNQRIIDIDRTGFFEKHVAEMELGNIADIRYTAKGIFASVFRFGTVTVQGTVGHGRIELVNVPDPASVQTRIQQIQKQHTKTKKQRQDEEEYTEEE